MNKLKMKKYTGKNRLWNIFCLLTGMMLLAWSQTGMAYTGQCTPDGGTYVYTYDFGNKQITDPSQDAAGTYFKDAYTWDLGSQYGIKCDCDPNDLSKAPMYFKSVIPLVPGDIIDSQQFYLVNDYIEVGATVWVAGGVNQYVALPWENEDDECTNCYKDCAGAYSWAFTNAGTGSKGQLSLYIRKPFINTVTINAKIADIYASGVSGSFGGTPVSSVVISGTVTVPQNCTVSPQTIPVPFGTMNSGDFTAKGQKPDSGRTRTISIPIKCTSATAEANLKLTLQATPSPSYPDAISTTNKDVGVMVTSENGARVLAPDSSTGYIPFTPDSSGDATVILKTYPVSTTGNRPAAGVFTALAYLYIDFA
ncbi:TPA: fimbrial protein [Klebsiella aerogenes]|nr:fimbrial protein [Klebsiella aerogenes]